jgi:hypothetical protein
MLTKATTWYSKGKDTIIKSKEALYTDAVLHALNAQKTLTDCSVSIGTCEPLPLQVTCDKIEESLLDTVHFEKWENDCYLVFEKQALANAEKIIEQVFGARKEAMLKHEKVKQGPYKMGCFPTAKYPQASPLFSKIQKLVYDTMCSTFNFFFHEYNFEGMLSDIEMKFISICLERIAATFLLFYAASYIANKEQIINYPEYCFSIAVTDTMEVKPYRLAIGSSFMTDEIRAAYQQLFDSYNISLTTLHKQSLLGVGWDFNAKIVKVYSTQTFSQALELHPFFRVSNVECSPYRSFCLVSASFDIKTGKQMESKVYAYPIEKVQVAPNQHCECAHMFSDKRGIVMQYDIPLVEEEIATQTYLHPLPWNLNAKAHEILKYFEQYKCLLYCIEPNANSTTLYLPFNF